MPPLPPPNAAPALASPGETLRPARSPCAPDAITAIRPFALPTRHEARFREDRDPRGSQAALKRSPPRIEFHPARAAGASLAREPVSRKPRTADRASAARQPSPPRRKGLPPLSSRRSRAEKNDR